MSLFSVPGSVLIKTTLLKSPQKSSSEHPLIKTSTDNSGWQTAPPLLRRLNFPIKFPN